MVLLTVRSLGSFLRTFSYSAMAFCSLPCWTNFSAALRAFCLLKPKPNAIKCADSSLFPVERPPTTQLGSRSKVIVRLGRTSPMVTDDYRGLPKGRVRPVFANPRGPLPEWEPRSRHPDATPSSRCRRLSRSDRSYSGKGFSVCVRTRSSLRDLNSFFHFPQR